MTARQILQDAYTSRNETYWPKTIVLGVMAMEQYARQQSIAFQEWKSQSGYRKMGDRYYSKWVKGASAGLDGLYDLWQAELTLNLKP